MMGTRLTEEERQCLFWLSRISGFGPIFTERVWSGIKQKTSLYNIEETPFEEGLRQAYAWYLKHQGEIEFNPAMDEIENQYLSECL